MKEGSERKTVAAVEQANQPENDTITLSTGVVLRVKKVPSLTLIKMLASSPRPKVPVYFNKNMGREIEHPDDPDYIERVRSWKIEISDMTLNALILLGTELVKCPKGVPSPESDKWIQKYSLLGQPITAENEYWRYLTWVTFVAATADSDMGLIQEVVGRLSGVPEAAVEATETFPAGQ